MNKQYYNFGNPFKVKFREHYCPKCKTRLSIVNHRKIVSQDSEEAKYYDFYAGSDGGMMLGSCEFVHKVFYCPKCSESIEFITKINLEDIDLLIKKVERYFSKRDEKISISKFFETQAGELNVEIDGIENIKNLCLFIEGIGRSILVCKIPLIRKSSWERPYYFDVSKKQLIKYIQENKQDEIKVNSK